MVGSWYGLVMCEKEPLLWTPPLPSNGQNTSKCGGILTKKQSAALTIEARFMNFLVLNPQVIPHRTGPSCQVLLGSRKKKFENFFLSTLIISISVNMMCCRKIIFENFFFLSTLISISVDMLGSRSCRKKNFFLKNFFVWDLFYPYYQYVKWRFRWNLVGRFIPWPSCVQMRTVAMDTTVA